MSEEQIKELGYEWNQKHCNPPLEDKEFEKQWKCAIRFINKNSKDQDPNNNSNNQQTSSSKKEGIELIELAARNNQ